MGARIQVFAASADGAIRAVLERVRGGMAHALTWANAVAIRARGNARAKGGRRWWGDLARSLQVREASPTEAEVSTPHVGAAQKQYGGRIVPVRAKALTIPIDPVARGRRAYELNSADRPLFRPKGTDILAWSVRTGRGKGRKATLRPLFALRKSVFQRPDPWFPPDDEIARMGLDEARRLAEKEIRQCCDTNSPQQPV